MAGIQETERAHEWMDMKKDSRSADYTVSPWFVHALGMGLIIPLFALTVGFHLLVWGPPLVSGGVTWIAVIIVSVVSLVAHELVHAAGFVYAAGASWREVRFGVAWKAMALYAHCDIAMYASVYRFVVALPAVTLGVVPTMLGIATGIGVLTLYGYVMLIVACGDLAILWAIRFIPDRVLVKDQSRRVGCEIVSGSEQRGSNLEVATAGPTIETFDSAMTYFVTFIVLAVGFMIGFFVLYPALM